MSDCEWLGTCPFFNDKMQGMPTTAQLAKNRYCCGTFNECSRYIVRAALGKEHVPADMFPDQQKRAKDLIELDRLLAAEKNSRKKS